MLRSTAFRLALLLFAGWPACAQTIYPPINTPVFRALDANGKPLSGGKLYTYAAGSSTPQSTYADPGGTSPNTNPVILDSTGAAKIFLAPQNYKFVLQDSNGVQQWTVDNITGAPPQSDVTSVFGRKGDVVAVIGDYTCSQITGAVCSIPTIYYQTIRAGGTDLTQRAKLNLIAGTSVSVNCVDNSGGNSTDCTVAYTGGGGTSRTCNSNGCYKIDADGTIFAWGTTSGSGTGHSGAVAVTFPTTFSSAPIVTVTANTCPNPSFCSGSSQSNISTNLVPGTLSTSGFSMYFGASVVIGGGGSDITSAATANWIAIGN